MLTSDQRVSECNEFIGYALHQFPGQCERGLAKSITRCKRCIASPLFARIEDGLCELCRAGDSAVSAAGQAAADEDERAELHGILQAACGRGPADYDALVMFSGGKDSTYLVHKLRADYPTLRILALTIDSGFASSVAMQHVSTVSASLDGVDSMVMRPHRDLFYRAFRHALTHPKPGSCYLTIDLLDGELTFDIGRNLAASMSIPLFLAGTSPAQLRLLHKLDWFERPRDIMLARRTHTTGGYAVTELSKEDALHYWWDGTRWPAERVPRNILPYHAWGYDEQFIKSEVVRLGYIEEGFDNPLITNNTLIPLMVCIDITRLGYCGFEPEFALLIRDGKADRTLWRNLFDAAAHLAEKGQFLPKCVDDVLAQLDLSRDQLGIPHPRAPGFE
ncbi:MAG: hypothetical protein MJE77_31835 [Proteobacteria bacterium]|nr:hypothetical protein [Pseudomonadota bacterium]